MKNFMKKTALLLFAASGGMGLGSSPARAQDLGTKPPAAPSVYRQTPIPGVGGYVLRPQRPPVWRLNPAPALPPTRVVPLHPSTGTHAPRDWSTGRDSFLAKPWM